MKKAILCVKEEVVNSPLFSPAEYAVEMANFCFSKGIKPIGCIWVDNNSNLFSILSVMEQKKKTVDYFMIYSSEQMAFEKIQMLMLANRVSDAFGAELITYHSK